MKKISFASDNYAGMHPDILKAITAANTDAVPAYGDDEYTTQAIEKFHEQFGKTCEVYFVLNGTAANVTALSALTHSYQAIICTANAHIQTDECGAFEKYTGSKLLLIPTENGKLTIPAIKPHLQRIGDQHHVQPKVISISQSTEYGTLYTVDEMKAIADFAHQHDLYLHIDGARISNAAAALNVSLAAITKDIGADVLSFGGTKNGLMVGDAVVFFNSTLAKDFLYIRKQSMQLISKMRFVSAQFAAFLSNDLWKKNAIHANQMAKLLEKKLLTVPQIKITQKVEANALFAILPKKVIPTLQEKFHFYVWNEALSEARLMTSFVTTEDEIDEFVKQLMQLISS